MYLSTIIKSILKNKINNNKNSTVNYDTIRINTFEMIVIYLKYENKLTVSL